MDISFDEAVRQIQSQSNVFGNQGASLRFVEERGGWVLDA